MNDRGAGLLERFAIASAVFGVVAASVAMAVLYVYLVPIFQASDEPEHFDYAISIARAGHLLSAKNALAYPEADLEADFLQTYTDFPRVTLNASDRAAPGYGTHRFFNRIDRRSQYQLPDPVAYMRRADHPNPQLISFYPFGYYLASATWLMAFWHFDPSLVSLFFAARLFSTACSALGLVVLYRCARLIGVERLEALALTAAIGLLPLSTFVASYVQPDNGTFLALDLVVYSALRIKRRPSATGFLWLGLSLGALSVMKYQFAFATVLATLPFAVAILAGARLGAAKTTAAVAAFAVPSIVTLAIQAFVVGTNAAFAKDVSTHFAAFNGWQTLGGDLLQFGKRAGDAVRYYFIGDIEPQLSSPTRVAAAVSYWGDSGYLDTPLTFGSAAANAFVRGTIATLTGLTIAVALLRAASVLVRSLRIAVRERAGRVLRCIACDVPANVYIVFIAFMIFFYAYTDNAWRTSGRNFYPIVFSTFAFYVVYAPRIVRNRRTRRLIARAAILSLCVYSATGGYFAAEAVQQRYYGPAYLPPLARLQRARPAPIELDHVGTTDVAVAQTALARAVQGTNLDITGWAIDPDRRDAAGGVIATVDGRTNVSASYGYATQYVADQLHRPRYFWSGFHLYVPTATLAYGVHRITFSIVSSDLKRAYPADRFVLVLVEPPGPGRPIPLDPRSGFEGGIDRYSSSDDPARGGEPAVIPWIDRGASLEVRGTVVDAAHRRAARGLNVYVDGALRTSAHLGEFSPQYVQHPLGDAPPGLEPFLGFSAIVPLAPLSLGDHRLSLRGIQPNGALGSDVTTELAFHTFVPPPPTAFERAPVPRPARFGDGVTTEGYLDLIGPFSEANLFAPNGGRIWVNRDEPFVAQGWALDLLRKRPLGVTVDFDCPRARFPASSGDLRTDIERAFIATIPAAATRYSGFFAEGALSTCAAGDHVATLTADSPRTGSRVTLLRVPVELF